MKEKEIFFSKGRERFFSTFFRIGLRVLSFCFSLSLHIFSLCSNCIDTETRAKAMTSAEPMETRAAAGASAGTSGKEPSAAAATTAAKAAAASSEKVNDALLAPLPAKPKFEAMSAFDANGRKIEFRRVRLGCVGLSSSAEGRTDKEENRGGREH